MKNIVPFYFSQLDDFFLVPLKVIYLDQIPFIDSIQSIADKHFVPH